MDNTESFKEKLDKQYDWPALYTFKFVSPIDKVEAIREIFHGHEIREKSSSKGNYKSLSIDMMIQSSEVVVNFYIEVNKLGEGIISL